jgi:hypothetical protein
MKKDISFYTTASQNLITIHHLRGLIERLNKKGPEVLFFRGISLIGDVYPTLGDREMLDVDVLVRESDLKRLTEVLQAMGLQETEPGVFHKTGFNLDIHTSFLNLSRIILERSSLTISMKDVFRRSVYKRFEDMEIKTLCPEHLFISTAIHLQSHSFGSHKGWEDLVRIKKYYRLSDEAILSEAKKMGAEHTLAYLNALSPNLFPSWQGKLSLGERWIIKRIKIGNLNQNFGDLLFIFQSRERLKALKEIFFPQGISLGVIGDRLWKCLLLLRDIIMRTRKDEASDITNQ